MNLNKQQVELALSAGLELLGDKSEVVVPVKLNDGIFLLKQLMMAIANGQLGLTPVTPPVPPALKPPGEKNPTPRGPKPKK
jgi:hypothetical protein